ncbi:MAG: hypothetical protein EPO35_08610 [Acidobacteria bacterium]|nr:MAG: hypothetical protein EPO35_08610 [Acidobacteriota bacterium]
MRSMRVIYRLSAIATLALASVFAAFTPVSTQSAAPKSPFDALHFRDIGPAITSGRIHDIQIDPKDPAVLYAASASGGLWKTTNKGMTWKNIFEGQPDNTFGAIAIFEGDTQILWAGTGEQNNRQSSSWGGGVYRSTNGGDTWTFVGLHDTRSIGRVVADPKDGNTAYVAAVGNLWAGSKDRGVYKTTDAGKTWTNTLYIDEYTGATDLVMDPRDPKVLYAATYQRLRSAWGFNGGGPGSAIYKTTDAGATWKKLENGIPPGDKGRIGLALAKSKPDVLVATIEHATATGTYRTEDAGATWKQMSRTNPRPMYYSKPTIDPNNDKTIWLPGTSIVHSEDGGVTWVEEPTSPTYDLGLKTDHHVLRVDPNNSNHIYVAGDGGLHESWDKGKSYVRNGNIPVAQAYRVAVDNRDPYWVYTGLQDNHSWMGPSATRHWLGIVNSDWVEIGFSDGTGKAVDLNDWRKVYSSSSGGNLSLVDPVTGDTLGITPRPPAGEQYRFDWDAPVMASKHTAGTVYLGGNKLFISKDYGITWTATKDLTRAIDRNPLKLMGVANTDVRLSKNDGDAISEISNIAESPLDAKILWVGTDDGNLQLSTDGGASWTDVTANLVRAGAKDGTFIGDIVASSSAKATAYVAVDAHRDGDFKAYLYKTTDFGKTFAAVTNGLPADDASVRGLAEFPGKPTVLFAGTERAMFVTHDGGDHWTKLTGNLPTTRYDDIVVHPRTKDLVLATHGRGIWILDNATPVAEWSQTVASERAHLFDVPRATLMLYWEDISNMGQDFHTSENPSEGAVFTYSLGQKADKVKFIVTNAAGRTVREVTGRADAGLILRANWDLRFAAPAGGGRGAGGGGGAGGMEEGGAGGGRAGVVQLPIPSHDIGPRGALVAPGTFKVTMEVDGAAMGSKTFDVRADPASNVPLAAHKAREQMVIDVADLQAKTDALMKDIAAKKPNATGDAAAKLTALEARIGAGGGGGRGGRGGGGAAAGQIPPVRTRLGGLLGNFTISGASTGTLLGPTPAQMITLAEVKREIAAIEKELAAIR